MVLFAKVVISTLALLPFFCFYRKTFRTTLGFTPSHSPYYIVLHFDSKNVTHLGSQKHLKEGTNTFRAKIRRLSDFIGIN